MNFIYDRLGDAVGGSVDFLKAEDAEKFARHFTGHEQQRLPPSIEVSKRSLAVGSSSGVLVTPSVNAGGICSESFVTRVQHSPEDSMSRG
jgi:hypothetical protein